MRLRVLRVPGEHHQLGVRRRLSNLPQAHVRIASSPRLSPPYEPEIPITAMPCSSGSLLGSGPGPSSHRRSVGGYWAPFRRAAASICACKRVEHGPRRLASHQDTPDRFVHRLGDVRPVDHVGTANGAGQGLLDRVEGLALLGRHAAVRIVPDRRPRVALDQHLLGLARHQEAGQRQGGLPAPPPIPRGMPRTSPPRTWAARTGPRHPA